MAKEKLKLKTKWTNHAEWSRYNKRNKKTKRELRKIVKNYGSFDFCFLLDIMDVMFKDMAEYYEKGDWVFTDYIDSESMRDTPSREEIAKELSKRLNAYWDADWGEELQRWEEFGDYFKKYLLYLWD